MRDKENYLARNSLLIAALELAQTLGVSRGAVLSDIRLNPSLVASIGTRVPAEAVIDGIESAARLSGKSDFGLRLGSHSDHRVAGVLGLLIEQATTLGEAVRFIRRYLHLHHDGYKLTLTHKSDNMQMLRFDIRAKGRYEPRHYLEVGTLHYVRLARLFLGADWIPMSVHFKHQAMSELAVYSRCFGPHVHFGETASGICFTSAELEQRNAPGEPEVRRKLEELLQELEISPTPSTPARVSELIRLLLPIGRATIEEVARLMATTPRTLQRKLRAHDLHFLDLLADTRMEMAREFLGPGGFTVAQAAPLLGFSEHSALSRFLRTHAGVKASALRKPSNGVR